MGKDEWRALPTNSHQALKMDETVGTDSHFEEREWSEFVGPLGRETSNRVTIDATIKAGI